MHHLARKQDCQQAEHGQRQADPPCHRGNQAPGFGTLAARQQSGEGGDEGGSQRPAGYQVEQDLGKAVGGEKGFAFRAGTEGLGGQGGSQQPDQLADHESRHDGGGGTGDLAVGAGGRAGILHAGIIPAAPRGLYNESII